MHGTLNIEPKTFNRKKKRKFPEIVIRMHFESDQIIFDYFKIEYLLINLYVLSYGTSHLLQKLFFAEIKTNF